MICLAPVLAKVALAVHERSTFQLLCVASVEYCKITSSSQYTLPSFPLLSPTLFGRGSHFTTCAASYDQHDPNTRCPRLEHTPLPFPRTATQLSPCISIRSVFSAPVRVDILSKELTPAQFDVSTPHIIFACLGGFVVFVSFFSSCRL